MKNRHTLYPMILLCATLSLLLGCIPIDSVINPDDERELGDIQFELDLNRAKWTSAMVSDYKFYFGWNCGLCGFGGDQRVTISVRDNKIVDIAGVVEVPPFVLFREPDYHTVDELFDFVQENIDRKIDQKVDFISADYDSELGYPTEVWIDGNIYALDDEIGFEIQWLSLE